MSLTSGESSLEIINPPSEVTQDVKESFTFRVNVDEATGPNVPEENRPLDVDIDASLQVAGDEENTTDTETQEKTIVDGSLSHSFEDLGAISVTVAAVIEFEDPSNEPNPTESVSDTIEVTVVPGKEESQFESFGDAGEQRKSLGQSYQDRVPFRIVDIEFEDDSQIPQDLTAPITLDEHPNPNVAIDTSGRFAKHEIIGGATVRQKIGEDPLNISVNGVCDASTANQIDALRDARSGTIISSRLPGSTRANNRSEGGGKIRVQFGSTKTQPIQDGGAADLTTGNLLYSFSINAIEVIQ